MPCTFDIKTLQIYVVSIPAFCNIVVSYLSKAKKKHCCLICGHLGARFGFVLDEELKKAASCDEVKDALAAKISRERIGVEVCICILK